MRVEIVEFDYEIKHNWSDESDPAILYMLLNAKDIFGQKPRWLISLKGSEPATMIG